MSESGSPWTSVFFGAAALLILFKAWRGWRLGVVRQVAGLVALVAGWLCALFGGSFAGPLLGTVWRAPDRVLSVVGGALLGFVVFVLISVGSAIVFKKTAQQSVGLVRVGYGLAGAAVGAGFGVVLVWMAVLAVRLLGTVAETQIAVETNPDFRARAPSAKKRPGAIVNGLAHLKHSLEAGPVGAVVGMLDPIPGPVYATLSKLGRVVSKPANVERFAQYPGVSNALGQPRLAALFGDAEFQRALHDRDYRAVLANPRLVAAANDPEVLAAVRRVDLQKALDFALGTPEVKKGDW